MIANPEQCAIVVPSCDAYSDLWAPFFCLFFRHWPDCPFKVYLGSNTLSFADSRAAVLKSGHGLDWATNSLDYLGQIREPVVLLWLEDFFLRSQVNSGAVSGIYREFCRRDAHMFRLVRRPGPTSLLPEGCFGPIRPGTPYRVSTQAAFWRRETLMSLIQPGESIWQFERAGSVRSNSYADGFYAVARDVVPYKHHVVQQGQWFPWEAWRFSRLNVGCDFSKRPIMPMRKASAWLVRKAVSVLAESFHLRAPLRRAVLRFKPGSRVED